MALKRQINFSRGEIAPELYSRYDLQQNGAGLKTCRNMKVIKHGGVQNRSGFEYVGPVQKWPQVSGGVGWWTVTGGSLWVDRKDFISQPTISRRNRLVPFVFNNDQTYCIVLGDKNANFIKHGAYVTNDPLSISAASLATSCAITTSAHGFTPGDMVYISGVVGMTQLNNRFFIVFPSSTTAFNIVDPTTGAYVDSTGYTAWSSGGYVYKIYSLTTPYPGDALDDLHTAQYMDDVVTARKGFAPQTITRTADNSWTCSDTSFKPVQAAPTSLVVTQSGTGVDGTADVYVVTGVSLDGEESLASATGTLASKYAYLDCPLTVTWTNASGAKYYNVYKKSNGIYGFVGVSDSGSNGFVDNGIEPDTTSVPPEDVDRFSAGMTLESANFIEARTGDINGRFAFSPDGLWFAVATSTSPYIVVYKKGSDGIFRYVGPLDTELQGAARKVAFSPNGKYMAVKHEGTTANLTVFKIKTNSNTLLDNWVTTGITVSEQPADGVHYGVCFSPDSRLLACTGGDPYVYVYEVLESSTADVTTFSRLGTGYFNPPGTYSAAYDCHFSSDGKWFAIAYGGSPYVIVYSISQSIYCQFTKITDVATVNIPDGPAKSVKYSPNCEYLALGLANSSYIALYTVNSSTGAITKLNEDDTAVVSALPSGQPYFGSIDWSPDSTHLAYGHETTPFETIYRRVGGVFTKQSNISPTPTSYVTGIGWSVDANKFVALPYDGNMLELCFTVSRNYPATVTHSQQRRLYGNSDSFPQRTWASKTGHLSNFTIGFPSQSDDSIIYDLAGPRVNQINSYVEIGGKLITLTSSSEVTIRGNQSGVITPTDINARVESYNGSSKLQPCTIDDTAFYIQGRDNQLRDLRYNFESEGYRGTDLSRFASHLFEGKKIISLAFQKIPDSTLWAVRSDGVLLGLTYDRDQQILGWHRHDTDGAFEDVCVVPDGDEDALYAIVRRTVGAKVCRYVERMSSRTVNNIEEYNFLDSSSLYDGRNKSSLLMTISQAGSIYTAGTTLTISASAPYFVSGDVGKAMHIKDDDGNIVRVEIVAVATSKSVTGTANIDVPSSLQEISTANWSKATKTVSGLWHLEGRSVSVYADGYVVANPNDSTKTVVTVSSGTITLSSQYSVIRVGLPYISDVETLDLKNTFDDKLPSSIGFRVRETRGLWVGQRPPDDDSVDTQKYLQPVREVYKDDGTKQDIGVEVTESTRVKPIELITGVIKPDSIESNWQGDGRVFIRQIDPVPVTISEIIVEGEGEAVD
jgi:hypothetical protein